jgi:TRAP-type C4-dicarboxylate transport system substrate-binding protein
MYRRRCCAWRVLTCALLCLHGLRPAHADDAKIALRVADSLPVTNFISVQAAQYFMTKAKELTHQRVDFQYFPGGQLGNAGDMLRLTATGVADIGFVAPGYISDKLPLSGVAELPGLYRSSCEGTHGFYSLAHGGILETHEFRPNGVIPLIAFNVGPEQIGIRDGGLHSLSGLKGLKIRGAGGTWDLVLRQLGTVPVNFAVSELHQAMVLGTIDGTVTSAMSMQPYDLTAVIKSMTKGAEFGSFAATYAINARKFRALPSDIQAALTEAGRDATEHFCAYVDSTEQGSFADAEKKGVAFWTLSPDEVGAVNEQLEPVVARWVATLDTRNLPGTEVLNAFRAQAH